MISKQQGTSSEIKIIEQYSQQWHRQNNFETRMFKIVRNVFKYGDAFLLEIPKQRLGSRRSQKVSSIIVNESRRQEVRTIYC